MQLLTGTLFVCAALKCSSRHFLPLSIYSQTTPSIKVKLLSKVELKTGNPFDCAELKFCSQDSKMLQKLTSCINLFPEHYFYTKLNFCQKWSGRQEPPLCMRDSNFAHKAQKCFSVYVLPLKMYSHFFYEKIKFWCKCSCRQEPTFMYGMLFWHADLLLV